LLGRISDPVLLLIRWIDFEYGLLNGRDHDLLFYKVELGDVLKRMELLWFLSDKLRALGLGGRQFIQLAAVLMSARLTNQILDIDEAFALLAS